MDKTQKIVFTNGCFDILHSGHLELLKKARTFGTYLIVGINSDRSVRAIKGESRPLNTQDERALMLESLKFVDEVRIFDAPTPLDLIKEIKPDVLIKGGDWQISEIIGADFVRENGGEVYSLPLVEGYSTTGIIEKILCQENKFADEKPLSNDKKDIIRASLAAHSKVFQTIIENQIDVIAECAEMIENCVVKGGKVLFCGNGGSAADAQHLAAEFVGRYESERRALPAVSLTTDTSALTALANDYGYEKVFARQVEALANDGDILVAISTSGNSPSIINAVMTARARNCRVIGLTGEKGKKLASLCDAAILAPSSRTARIQEAHITIGHIWCELIDWHFARQSKSDAA